MSCNLSADYEAESDASTHESDAAFEEEVWICYNPKSSFHGSICTADCFYSDGLRNKNSFCWLIEKHNCIQPLQFEWQKENCHHFR